ncbi:hypothetical protein MKMG_02047 [Methanogenium sp. MK-MG]|nr:hypothetical protein MKMG_02047 [Methanogenium sp. MK-MG]
MTVCPFVKGCLLFPVGILRSCIRLVVNECIPDGNRLVGDELNEVFERFLTCSLIEVLPQGLHAS